MKDFKKLLWASLSKHKLSSVWRWAFLNSVLKKYIEEKFGVKINLKWKIQHNVYFVYLSNSVLSNQVFLNKNKIKNFLNKKLETMNFQKIKDIKFG